MRHKPRKRSLGERLAREAREYLADLRSMLASLQTAEGAIALVLIGIICALAAAWFVFGLGFDRLLSVAASLGAARVVSCRDVSDAQGLFLIVGGVVFFLVSALALGEMMRLIDRARHSRPLNAKSVLIPALFMVITGISGIAAMRLWC